MTSGRSSRAVSGCRLVSLVIVWHLLADPAAHYRDLGSDFYAKRIDKNRRQRHLIRQLEALGYTVTLEALPMAA